MWSPTDQVTAHAALVVRGLISLALMRDGISCERDIMQACTRPFEAFSKTCLARRPTAKTIQRDLDY